MCCHAMFFVEGWPLFLFILTKKAQKTITIQYILLLQLLFGKGIMGIFVRFFGVALFAMVSSGLIAGGYDKSEEEPLPEWKNAPKKVNLYYDIPSGNTVFTSYELSKEAQSKNASPNSTINLRASGSQEAYP